MHEATANSKFDHCFAIVRVDQALPDSGVVDEHLATVKKVVWSMPDAEREVARLNALVLGKRYRYHWQLTRLERVDKGLHDIEQPTKVEGSDSDTSLAGHEQRSLGDGSKFDAASLFEESIGWLQTHYHEFSFHLERDLVWTLQSHLEARVREEGWSVRDFNDYKMLPGKRRGISADLVLAGANRQPLVAAEIKYEPDHGRADVPPEKLPVIGWASSLRDIDRIHQFVGAGATPVGFALLIDEGRFFRKMDAPEGSSWIDWEAKTPEGCSVSLLWTRWPAAAEISAHQGTIPAREPTLR